jgi:asparagine synthase (glutamine-hydrolysing)
MLYEFFDKQRLHELVESKGEAFRVPWFGQLMSGPQLLAHLAQMHVWFNDYKIEIVE